MQEALCRELSRPVSRRPGPSATHFSRHLPTAPRGTLTKVPIVPDFASSSLLQDLPLEGALHSTLCPMFTQPHGSESPLDANTHLLPSPRPHLGRLCDSSCLRTYLSPTDTALMRLPLPLGAPSTARSCILVTQAETLGVILGCPPALTTHLTQREIKLALQIHRLPTSAPGGHLPCPAPGPWPLTWVTTVISLVPPFPKAVWRGSGVMRSKPLQPARHC